MFIDWFIYWFLPVPNNQHRRVEWLKRFSTDRIRTVSRTVYWSPDTVARFLAISPLLLNLNPVCLGLIHSFTVYYCSLLFITVYYCLLLFITVYYCSLLFITVYYCSLLFITVIWPTPRSASQWIQTPVVSSTWWETTNSRLHSGESVTQTHAVLPLLQQRSNAILLCSGTPVNTHRRRLLPLVHSISGDVDGGHTVGGPHHADRHQGPEGLAHLVGIACRWTV